VTEQVALQSTQSTDMGSDSAVCFSSPRQPAHLDSIVELSSRYRGSRSAPVHRGSCGKAELLAPEAVPGESTSVLNFLLKRKNAGKKVLKVCRKNES
jgi:hypothetical protein